MNHSLSSLNLNLLVTLQVLLRCCHVSQAANELNITQSAVSKQLAQLRECFDDPLLVREGNTLLMTPRAKTLLAELDVLLGQIQHFIEPMEFSPSKLTGTYTLASSDYVAQFLLPEIVSELVDKAPNLAINYQLWSPEKLEHLAELDVELVSTMLPDVPAGLHGQLMGSDQPCCVMSAHHPLAENVSLTLSELLEYPFASVSGGGDKDSFFDKELSSLGLKRNVRFNVPFFTSALTTVSSSEMLLIIPEHIAVTMTSFFDVVYKPLPIKAPTYKYWLIWHPKYHTDPSHRWFREQVMGVIRSSSFSIGYSSNS